MKPNHRLDVHVVSDGGSEGLEGEDEDDVDGVVVVASLHRPNQPGVLHVVLEGVLVIVLVIVVTVGLGDGAGDDIAGEEAVEVGSLQPNQPGVLQLDVDDDVVVEEVVVVVSSRQPNQPGVLHVSVLVRVYVLVLGTELLVVVSVPLLSKNFQL